MFLQHARTSLTATASCIVLFLSLWTVLPAPLRIFVPLGVGAPEVSPWLLVTAVLLGAATLLDPGGGRLRQVALICACTAAFLAAIPLVRVAIAIPHLQAAMRGALGDDYLSGVPSSVRAGMRRSPLLARDLFLGLDASEAPPSAAVVFGSENGATLRMEVHPAATPGPHPAVVQIYGGSWQRGQPGDNAAFARYLAARGYVVFAIDYRHAPEWQWTAQVDDVRTALAWIRSHGAGFGADVSRLAIVGRSAGAHLALLAAYMPAAGAPPVSAVVSLYGPTDLTRGFREPPVPDPLDVRSILRAFVGGTPDDQAQAYVAASPITYASHPQPPTLLIYGGRDHVVRPSFGAALDSRLRATGTKTILLEFPWAEHAFDAVPFGPGGQLALYYCERFLAWALYSGRTR